MKEIEKQKKIYSLKSSKLIYDNNSYGTNYPNQFSKPITNYRKFLGKVLVDDDFFLFRPTHNYRVNANIIVLRTDPPIILETGTKKNPPLINILRVLNYHHISTEEIKFLILSHNHQDHFQNLREFQKVFKKSKVIAPKADIDIINVPYRLNKSWKQGMQFYFSIPAFYYIYKWYYMILSNVYFKTLQVPNRIDYTIEGNYTLKLQDEKLLFIPTPGHSNGHYCFLDDRKNLFLADMVPFTPWIEPTANSIDQIINSIEKLLKFSENKVKRAIRAHGDVRKKSHLNWEISKWSDEKERFMFFLDTINSTLDKIPKILENKCLNASQLTSIIIPQYRHYSKMMTTLFMPPAVSWGIAYALKLAKDGKIHIKKKKGRIFWTN